MRATTATVLLVLPLLGAGCISFRGAAKADGGLFLSKDRGEQWVQRGSILSVGSERRSLANANITTIVQDPQDRNAFYVGTEANGGFSSWDGGAAWWPLGGPLTGGRVDAIAVDPRATCTIHVAAGKKVYTTSDCTRSWRSSDFESAVTAIAVDPLRPAWLYAGNTRGDLLKSTDGGVSWRAIRRFDNRIASLRIVSRPTAGGAPVTIYAATKMSGIHRSTDDGGTWTDLRKGMEQFEGAFDFRSLAVALEPRVTLVHASKYGLLRSMDAGVTWEPLTLLTAPRTVDLLSLAVNPMAANELVYATATTLYRSTDGGGRWVSKKLPTTRVASVFLVDAADGKTLWMGTQKVEK